MLVKNLNTGHQWNILKEEEILKISKNKEFEIISISDDEKKIIDKLKKEIPKTLEQKLMTPY